MLGALLLGFEKRKVLCGASRRKRCSRPGAGLLPALGGILLSVVIGFYVRKFLVNKLYQPNRQCNHEPLALEWQVPELTPAQVDVWRAMLTYSYPMSPEVRRMLRDALK